jgi:2-beta-glucuronyltransferase
MESLRLHPLVRRLETVLAARCDIVSTPSAYLHRRFERLPNAYLHGHAIDKSVFDEPVPSPYTSPLNAVFLGFYQPDVAFLRAAAQAHPEVTFHIVGQRIDLGEPNIISHGEVPFRDTLPFVKHADIGLHTVAYRPGAEALTDALKVIQFSYCGIPIIAPAFLESSRPNVVAYEPGDRASAADAISAALALDVTPASNIPSWEDLATLLAGGG